MTPLSAPGPIAVAIPAKNEAGRIAACLLALARQRHGPPEHVVLVVNNTTDATARIARTLEMPMRLHLVEAHLPPGQAHAGAARRMAMQHAAGLVGAEGVLLGTDADGRVDSGWLEANLSHLRRGVDAVAGRSVIDPAEAALIPARLHEDDAREQAYAAALDEIASLLDPDPWDPWPRHTEHSGASIAVTAAAFHRAGGMPAPPVGEDRAFFAALRRVDARIRHAPEVRVTVSGRTAGRAAGGMADTIRRRLQAPDPFLDDALEPAQHAVRRARLRRLCRDAYRAGRPDDAATMLGVPVAAAEAAFAAGVFGQAWAALEAESPLLAWDPVAAADLPAQMADAERTLRTLRERQAVAVPA